MKKTKKNDVNIMYLHFIYIKYELWIVFFLVNTRCYGNVYLLFKR